MVNTKATKHTGAQRCPMCSTICSTAEAFKRHVIDCAMKEYMCEVCDYKSNKQANVRRHHQRNHKGLVPGTLPTPLGRKDNQDVTTTSANKPDEESDWLEQDPGDLITEDERSSDDNGAGSADDESYAEERDLLVGRMIRKPTKPAPVSSKRAAPRAETVVTAPKQLRLAEDTISDVIAECQSPTSSDHQSATVKPVVTSLTRSVGSQVHVGQSTRPDTKDVGTQCEKYRRRFKEIRTTKYMEGGREVVVVQETEEFYNM